MPADFTIPLWLLKLGSLVNLYFLAGTFALPSVAADPHIVVPARILFAVSAYRCLFPNRYQDNVVLHATPLSSTGVTRLLATFVEVAWIYQFSHVLRLLNAGDVGWVDALSWLMVVQVVVSQGFVWGAIVSGRLALYFWEELGWAVIFAANTAASALLYLHPDALVGREILIQLNLLFGLFYLPWQVFHLRSIRAEAKAQPRKAVTWKRLAAGLGRSFSETNRSTDAAAWGGVIGLTWMTAYWATLVPIWVHRVVVVFAP